MKILSRWLIGAAVTIGPVLVVSGTAAAASSTSNTTVNLSVKSVSASSVDLALTGQLAQVVSGQEITFFVQTQEFASRGWMAVGSALTNSLGVATYSYTPTWTGTEVFGAALGSSAAVSAPSVTESFQVLKDPPGVPQSVIEYARPMGSTGGILVKSLLGIVAIIWVLLLGSLALVIRRMPRLAGLPAVGNGQNGRQ